MNVRATGDTRPVEIETGHFCRLSLVADFSLWAKVRGLTAQGYDGVIIARPDIRITFRGRHIREAFLPTSGRVKQGAKKSK